MVEKRLGVVACVTAVNGEGREDLTVLCVRSGHSLFGVFIRNDSEEGNTLLDVELVFN